MNSRGFNFAVSGLGGTNYMLESMIHYHLTLKKQLTIVRKRNKFMD